MPTPLETATVDLDRKTVAALGDTFTYTPVGGPSVTGVLGFVEYEEEITNAAPGGGAGSVSQVMTVDLDAAQFPIRPNEDCRVTNIARFPGLIYQPVGVTVADTGFWRFGLKRVAA